jgi:hypothetical protein
VNDPGLVVHKGGMLQVKAGGIVPRSEIILLFFSNVVSFNSNDNEWGALSLFPCFTLESENVLETNGEGVAEICGGDEGDCRTFWIDPSSARCRVDSSLLCRYLLTDHDGWTYVRGSY